MKELKRLNNFILKYKGKLLLGLLITIISRVFSIVTPRLVGDSMTTIENYLSLSNISIDKINNNVYRVYKGPFNNIKSIKIEFDKINLMDFDNIDIIKL